MIQQFHGLNLKRMVCNQETPGARTISNLRTSHLTHTSSILEYIKIYFESLKADTAVYAQVMRRCRAPHAWVIFFDAVLNILATLNLKPMIPHTNTQPELNLGWAGGTFQVSIPNFPRSAHRRRGLPETVNG